MKRCSIYNFAFENGRRTVKSTHSFRTLPQSEVPLAKRFIQRSYGSVSSRNEDVSLSVQGRIGFLPQIITLEMCIWRFATELDIRSVKQFAKPSSAGQSGRSGAKESNVIVSNGEKKDACLEWHNKSK